MSNIINLKETRKNIEQSLLFINRDKKLGKQVRFQHVHTLNKIVYLQACRLSHYAGLGMLSAGNQVTASDIACNKPKAYLAKCCQVTSKTIQNHIKRLEENELVKRINKEGKLLLIVNPMLLSISSNFPHLQAVLWENFKNANCNISNCLDFCREKIFPINYHTGNLKSIITKSVDNIKKESQSDSVKQDTRKAKQEENNSQDKKVASVPFISKYSSNRKQREAKNIEARRQQFIQKQVLRLWMWCLENLYADRKFISESQEEYVIVYFTESFEKLSGAEIYTQISHLYKRLGKWKRFVSKESTLKRFTPLPSSFFNLANPHGFEKTKQWLVDEKKREAHNKALKLAKQLERKTAQVLAGYFPEKKLNPITRKRETFYRSLTISEKLKELQKLEFQVTKINQQFPSIGKWYTHQLKQLIYKIETKQVT